MSYNARELAARRFLSTLSLRRATLCFVFLGSVEVFLSTLSLRRATPRAAHEAVLAAFLSTLSLRRATQKALDQLTLSAYFYPRSPCGERQRCQASDISVKRDFYPRSPCGERRVVGFGRHNNTDFYPRSPCGERHAKNGYARMATLISIHALLAESDRACPLWTTASPRFLSTLSLRRATGAGSRVCTTCFNFYPRSPCGERQLNSS